MNEEKLLILEMVKEGKITTEEADKLLEGVQVQPKSPSRKFLRVLVTDGDKTQINLNVPIALAEIGLKFVPKEKLVVDGQEINVDGILKLIQEGSEGELVNLERVEGGREIKVKVTID